MKLKTILYCIFFYKKKMKKKNSFIHYIIMGRIMGQNVSINRDIYKHKETSSSKEHWVNFSTLDRDATNQSVLAR